MGVTVVMASVNLINVHKSFGGDAHVVKGVNISINDGDYVQRVRKKSGSSGASSKRKRRTASGLEGDAVPTASTLPEASANRTNAVSGASCSAPENTHGWRLDRSASLPGFRRRMG